MVPEAALIEPYPWEHMRVSTDDLRRGPPDDPLTQARNVMGSRRETTMPDPHVRSGASKETSWEIASTHCRAKTEGESTPRVVARMYMPNCCIVTTSTDASRESVFRHERGVIAPSVMPSTVRWPLFLSHSRFELLPPPSSREPA